MCPEKRLVIYHGVKRIKRRCAQQPYGKFLGPPFIPAMLMLLIVCGLVFSSPAIVKAEETAVGSIDRVVGTVFVQNDGGQTRRAKKGTLLLPGDTITTEADGEVGFALDRVGMFTLFSNAKLSIDDLYFEESDEARVIRLIVGYLKAKVQHSGSRSLEVHSPCAVMGVRGTEFDAVASVDGSTVLTVDDGKVALDAGGRSVLVNRGQMVDASYGKPLSAPGPAIVRAKRNWMKWRSRARRRLIAHMPEVVGRLLRVMTKLDKKAKANETVILRRAKRLADALVTLKRVRRRRHTAGVAAAKKRVMARARDLKAAVWPYRRLSNRIRATGALCRRVGMVYAANRNQYGEDQAEAIMKDLSAIKAIAQRMQTRSALVRKKIVSGFRRLRPVRGLSR